MKKVLIVANHFVTIYAFRRELVQRIIEQGDEVYLALPPSEDNNYFKKIGCKIIETPLDRRGTNPLKDIKLFFCYVKLIRDIEPDIVLTYTIKPNIYGGIASRVCKVKNLHTVTGLGTVYIRDIWQKHLIILLNKIAFKNASNVVFLNEENREFYKKLKIISPLHNTLLVPGSGVNLDEFKYQDNVNKEKVIFTFVGRVLKDKGIEEYLYAAKELVSKYNNVEFEVVGFVDEEKYSKLLKSYEIEGIIKYLGRRNDIPEIMANSSCVVLPSYGEGRGTVLQEGAAIGRPLITCNTYGCKENVEDGYNGFLCHVADPHSLINSMEKFINLTQREKNIMGKRSRKKAEREFDRNKVIEAYIDEINQIVESRQE